MNTQMPILTGASASAKAAALPSSQAESLTAEVPFNKMLSKEVSNRANAANAPAPAPAPTPSAASNNDSQAQNRVQNQSKPAEASKDNNQDAAKESSAAAASGTAAASSNAKSSTSSSDAAKDSKDADQAKQDDDQQDNVSTPASAQMLALVANVGHLNQPSHVQQAGAHQASGEDMDALGNQKGGKKAIGQIGAHGKHEPLDLKAEGEEAGHGKKEKGELFALGGGALEAKQTLGKDAAEGDVKPGPAVRGAVSGEKSPGESSLLTRNTLGSGPDASALTQTHTKFTLPESKPVKAADTLTPQAAAAAVVAPGMQQTMSLNQQAALSGQAVDRLTPPVGSQGWDQAVGQKVVWMVNGGTQSASLTLNPPDLGPLQIVLHVNNDQADATFITAQPEVKQALENAMPKLREMLDQAGIQLSQATVNTGMPNQQQGAQQQQFAQNGGNNRLGGNGGGKDDGELNVSTVPVRSATGGGGQGLVDTFA